MSTSFLYKPVIIIDGIGSTIAKKLKRVSVINVIDLLRVSPRFIYNFLKHKEGRAEVEGWHSQASLLQVYDMTPLYSKILFKSGMLNVEYLSFSTLIKVKEILTKASGEYKTFTMPADDDICNWIKDSTRIHFTGSVSGFVISPKGKAVKGAEVKAGGQTGYTDYKGRFRLIRVPLGRKTKIKITHTSYSTFESGAEPVFGNNTIAANLYKLKKAPKKSTLRKKLVNADEFKGEEIPRPNNFERKSAPRKLSELRTGDLFIVQKIAQTKNDGIMVTLLSRFREVKDSVYYLYTWKFPLSDLPSGIKELDHLSYNGKIFKTVKMYPGKMDFIMDIKKATQLANKGRKNIKIRTPKDIDKALKNWFKAYKTVIREK